MLRETFAARDPSPPAPDAPQEKQAERSARGVERHVPDGGPSGSTVKAWWISSARGPQRGAEQGLAGDRPAPRPRGRGGPAAASARHQSPARHRVLRHVGRLANPEARADSTVASVSPSDSQRRKGPMKRDVWPGLENASVDPAKMNAIQRRRPAASRARARPRGPVDPPGGGIGRAHRGAGGHGPRRQLRPARSPGRSSRSRTRPSPARPSRGWRFSRSRRRSPCGSCPARPSRGRSRP